MPMYDYRCENAECAHVFEKYKKATSIDDVFCPNCGAKAERQICAPHVADPAAINTTSKIPQQFKDQMSKIEKTYGLAQKSFL